MLAARRARDAAAYKTVAHLAVGFVEAARFWGAAVRSLKNQTKSQPSFSLSQPRKRRIKHVAVPVQAYKIPKYAMGKIWKNFSTFCGS